MLLLSLFLLLLSLPLFLLLSLLSMLLFFATPLELQMGKNGDRLPWRLQHRSVRH